ncbi:phosphoribosylglycinamide formyltransferase [Virgibacillus dakarensis]|uniref:phosphoribosylglycinamide formyltransferase n=1 Tax=Virgibacillus dakarensis TaxID=1917889 RepID=UPI000B44B034|nr:phosphoribosylglycinamide formyltransferase [Virgibacillus dakarensis]MBT2217450.1 phosphoribosylglycinamide formyltransferase [Virgibacillus dakarensis]MTW86284.1 phosphoribosylglycinamide formyltransferase [Virgibacillus dakarensis]
MERKKAAVFASGAGSNFQAMMENKLVCDIVLLVCDKPGATVIDKAKKFGIPVFVFDPKQYPTKLDYEQEILAKLQFAEAEWIFLAGYMRIIGPTLLKHYRKKIINIHPSLLPAFPGKDAIDQAYVAKAKTTGVTIHYVDEGIDTGPIIAQRQVEILPGDTKETLKMRIQRVEHQLYPQVINQILGKQQGVS